MKRLVCIYIYVSALALSLPSVSCAEEETPSALLPPTGSQQRRRKRAMYESILFPNRSYTENPFEVASVVESHSGESSQSMIIPAASYAALAAEEDLHGRKLRLEQPSDFVANKVQCSNCQGLDKCRVLNGKLIEERYYGSINLQYGTCTIIESLGVRMDEEIFGQGRAFRDTPQCREIVMQYLCLFWGSQNSMYRNYCYWKEDVSNPDPTRHVIAPRPPCRSFCVQVAEVCANEYDFLDICKNIACPPKEDECTPDPLVNGQLVAADIGCYIPYLRSPYNAALPRAGAPYLLVFLSVLLTAMWFNDLL